MIQDTIVKINDAKSFSYDSMGTTWKVFIWDDISDEKLAELEKEIVNMSIDFDNTYSRFIKTSLVWKIADLGAGEYEVPQDFTNMLQMYFDFYDISEKKLNPLVGFTIHDLGYDDEYSLTPQEIIRQTPDLLDTVKIIDATHIRITQSALFDFGALGKGYFVDKIANYLKLKGTKHFLVDGSGDVYYFDVNKKPIEIGLEHPDNATMAIGKITHTHGALCASGINRRRWREYHHVIDPHTGTSIREQIKATWVSAENAALADALASCLFFVLPEAQSAHIFDYVVMNDKNKIKKSSSSVLVHVF